MSCAPTANPNPNRQPEPSRREGITPTGAPRFRGTESNRKTGPAQKGRRGDQRQGHRVRLPRGTESKPPGDTANHGHRVFFLRFFGRFFPGRLLARANAPLRAGGAEGDGATANHRRRPSAVSRNERLGDTPGAVLNPMPRSVEPYHTNPSARRRRC